MGNSEVGHMNLGAGRVVYQNLTRIDKDIADGSFASNAELTQAIAASAETASALHVFGLLSPGGIHSHEDQIFALLELALARGANQVYLHAFLDGRDTPPRSALASLKRADSLLAASGRGRVASLSGRFYAMDRDNRWDRVEPAYDLLTAGSAEFSYASAEAGLEAAYARGEDDEFVKPTVIGSSPAPVADGDAVVFMNFRSDRARELSRAFLQTDFDGFTRKRVPELSRFVTLTHYADDIDAPCAYPPEALQNVLGETLAKQGKTQLRIAETEKYAHVTFFLTAAERSLSPRRSASSSPRQT
jgi:2,3-bisphosphoglycerate-independent phosphoglycerate mutase